MRENDIKSAIQRLTEEEISLFKDLLSFKSLTEDRQVEVVKWLKLKEVPEEVVEGLLRIGRKGC